MTLEIETIVAISVMMAVFSAVAALGSSLVLGAGFERLRCGFEVIRKQTGFFSDAIHKLEQKVEEVDEHTTTFSGAIAEMKNQVGEVGQQAAAFTNSMKQLERKVEIVDKQTGYFGDAIHKLEQKIETVSAHEQAVSEKMEHYAGTDLISTDKTEALVSQAENLLTQMSALAAQMTGKNQNHIETPAAQLNVSMPRSLDDYVWGSGAPGETIRYH